MDNFRTFFLYLGLLAAAAAIAGCGAQPGAPNVNLANAGSNSNSSNTFAKNANTSSANSSAASSAVDAKEPEQYQATVTIKLEAVGDQQKTALPALSAVVARNSADRRMEFTMPAGGRVVFLDKAGTNYLIMPEKKQYAELTRDALGFDVRRMLMPEQIVQQVKNVAGMERVGDEKYDGRDVVKYRYAAVADSQTKAGQVKTESFLLVDKETGLPLHSETISQSQSGTSMQGYNGIRVVTEITDLKTTTPPDLFALPADLQKIEASQVRGQVDLIFNAVSAFLSQMMKQAGGAANPPATPGG